MAVSIRRGKSDDIIKHFIAVLNKYAANHPQAQIELYRQNPVSVRIRIIDSGFAGEETHSRIEKIWQYLNRLPKEVESDIGMLLLLTPDETEKSFANMEFEDPVPSRLDPAFMGKTANGQTKRPKTTYR